MFGAIILTIIIIVLIITVGFVIVETQNINLEREKFYESIDFDSKNDILDKIIDDELTSYRIFNLEYQQDLYIDQELQMKIITDVTTAVYKRLSPALEYNVNINYNTKNKEELLNVILQRVSIATIPYVKEINKVK